MLIQAALAIALASQGAEASTGISPSALQRSGDSTLVRAEALLAAGNLAGARRIAERLEDRNPNDVRVIVLLGRIHLDWPVIGRFTAESLFVRAGRLAPDEPESFYWLGHVGLKLGGDDGESIARRGLLRVLEIDPTYRDAWTLWRRLYAGDRQLRDVVRAMERRAGEYRPDLWRAQTLIELREQATAIPLLADLERRDPGDVRPLALHARALFELGRDEEGAAVYRRALALASRDTAQVLWLQLRGTASPAERQAWAGTPPEGREAFLRLFWTRREPDLFTPGNERIGEHFRRFVDARRNFRLLHPNSRYHRSAIHRTLAGGVNPVRNPELAMMARRAQDNWCGGMQYDSLTRLQYEQGLSPRVDSGSAPGSVQLEDGLDDRGRVWLRHGEPTMRVTYGLDGETWCYMRADGVLRVTFMRRTGGSYWGASGDVVFTPVLPGEAVAAVVLTSTDRAAVDYRLAFSFWHATFRADDSRYTDLILVTDSLRTMAAIVDEQGHRMAADSATGQPLTLAGPPGHYLLQLDARRGAEIGSHRGSIALPDYATGGLAVSGLLVAPRDAAADRASMARSAPPGLRFPAGEPFRFYAEIYGLAQQDGTGRYDARYRFERLDGDEVGSSTTITFEREVAITPRVVETLVVDPGRLAPGRYRVRLEITDRIRGTSTVGALMQFVLR